MLVEAFLGRCVIDSPDSGRLASSRLARKIIFEENTKILVIMMEALCDLLQPRLVGKFIKKSFARGMLGGAGASKVQAERFPVLFFRGPRRMNSVHSQCFGCFLTALFAL